MSERLSKGERKCFDKIFQIVRGENGTLDKLEDLKFSRRLFQKFARDLAAILKL